MPGSRPVLPQGTSMQVTRRDMALTTSSHYPHQRTTNTPDNSPMWAPARASTGHTTSPETTAPPHPSPSGSAPPAQRCDLISLIYRSLLSGHALPSPPACPHPRFVSWYLTGWGVGDWFWGAPATPGPRYRKTQPLGLRVASQSPTPQAQDDRAASKPLMCASGHSLAFPRWERN